MRAAVLQFDVTHDPSANLRAVEEGLRDAARGGAELVVLPEMWPTSFPAQGSIHAHLRATDAAWERVGRLSRELELCVAGSGFGRTEGLPTNRMQVIEHGEPRLSYDKVHLFSPTAEGSTFSAGDEPPPVAETRVGRLTACVCYDLRFAGLLNRPWREGFDLLLVSAQWPVPRIAHWRALVIARAVERQAFVIACNRTGHAEVGRRRMPLEFPGQSLIVSPHGEVLVDAGSSPGASCADLDFEEARAYRVRIPLAKDERPEVYG